MAKSRSAEPITNAVHLCIDMQNIFGRGGVWPTPWMERVLPVVVNLVEYNPVRTVFTRFITPHAADERPGRWQRYFSRWRLATQAHLPPQALELISPLNRFAPPATIIDKPAYSAFFKSRLPVFSQQKASALSSSRAQKRTSACFPRFLMPLTKAFASSWSRTACAVLPTPGMMPS
jgi:nicotinamidase-related amidase